MRFGTVRRSNVVGFETLGEAKKQVKGTSGALRVVILLDEGEGYTGVVSRVDVGGGKLEPQITVENVKGGTVTIRINGKRVLILDPVCVSELEVEEVD